jgi:hypothetical protein
MILLQYHLEHCILKEAFFLENHKRSNAEQNVSRIKETKQ